VNWAFAEAAAEEAAPRCCGRGIHDYNLWLVPGYLRTVAAGCKAFPSSTTPRSRRPDIFNVLPWRKEIVGSLLACDIDRIPHSALFSEFRSGRAQSLLRCRGRSKREKVPDESRFHLGRHRAGRTARCRPKSVLYEDRKIKISCAAGRRRLSISSPSAPNFTETTRQDAS
jgi:hypothetical protein